MEMAVNAPAAPLGYIDKGRVLLACVVAIVLLRSVGWMVAQPADPDLAISFTNGDGTPLRAWPALAVLTVVAAALGGAITGRRLPEAGVFAAGVGLAALAIRGGSMEAMLCYETTADVATRRALMGAMALDCLLWTVLMGITWVANTLVWRWLWPEPAVAEADDDGAGQAGTGGNQAKKNVDAVKSANFWAGWPALAITGVIGALVIWMTIARTPVATIARGQVIASVTAALYLGAMGARYFTGINDARWYVLAAPAVALIGYLLGYVSADMSWAVSGGYKFYAELATTPAHAMARPLPIEYLAIGVAAALMGFWSGEKIEHAAAHEES